MQYVAFVFAIFGFISYFQISSLKKRIENLERELTKVNGTSYQKTDMHCCRPSNLM